MCSVGWLSFALRFASWSKLSTLPFILVNQPSANGAHEGPTSG
jgi:hypothetical protein